jgi:hypothetical protein
MKTDSEVLIKNKPIIISVKKYWQTSPIIDIRYC